MAEATEAVRDARYKYIRFVESEPLYEELFDLKNDPDEAHKAVDRIMACKPVYLYLTLRRVYDRGRVLTIGTMIVLVCVHMVAMVVTAIATLAATIALS